MKGLKRILRRDQEGSRRTQGQAVADSPQSDPPRATEDATASETGGLVSEKDLEETFPVGIHSWVEPSEPVIDICFVHGLSGNYKSTWTHPSTDTPWPKTLIEEEFPDLRARIVSYGYDAYCVRRHGVVSTNRLEDHAVNFMHAINNDRDKHGTRESPLIVIAHSLGGLVTKLAILKSRDSPEPEERNLYKHLEGILFMGTPHKGAWTASLAKAPLHILGIVKSTNASLLRVLQVGDSQLLEVHSSFMQLRRRLENTAQEASDRKEIRIKCFREELPT